MSNRPLYLASGILLALASGELYLFRTARGIEKEASRVEQTLIAEMTRLREATLADDHADSVELEVLRDELRFAKGEAVRAAHQARRQAQKHAEELVRSMADERQRQEEQVASELSHVQAATLAAREAIGELHGQIEDTRTEASRTRGEVGRARSDLKRVVGDLGVLSGAIATNSQELAALEALGDRNYFQFHLNKSDRRKTIAGISILLKKADPNRNRYTIELLADNRKLQKKDCDINQPVQFYVSNPRQLYELVVNAVAKNEVQGYLATPKVTQIARK